MLTLLKFKAEWCAPCKAMLPAMETIKEEFKDTMIVSDVDIDDNPQLRLDFHIRSIPAFVLVKDGKEISRSIGSKTIGELRDWLNESRNL